MEDKKQEKYLENIAEVVLEMLCVDDSAEAFVENKFGIILHNNQRDIVRVLVDQSYRKAIVVEARQTGKSTSVALACAFAMEAFENNRNNGEPLRIGVFAPILDQALLDLSKLRLYCERNPNARALIDWKRTVADKIVWHNGAELYAHSASEQAHTEGLTFDIIIIEEAQAVGDYILSERILPMGGSRSAKIVKIGTPRGVRNHFWRAWHDAALGYEKVSHHWMDCENLQIGDVIVVEVDGVKKTISKFILDLMPISVKQRLFPTNQSLWFPGEMDEETFGTQYELKWNETHGLYLNDSERDRMIGNHALQENQSQGDTVFAGIDFNASSGDQADETAIAVWRVLPNGVKEKVFGVCIHGDLNNQIDTIINLFNRNTGKFKPAKILVDATGAGSYPAAMLRKNGVDVIEILFGEIDEVEAKKGYRLNYKNSMCS